MKTAYYKYTIITYLILFSLTINAKVNFTPEQVVKLKNKEILININYKNNKSWPTFNLISYLDTSALEAFAVFSQFNLQKKYVLNVIESKAKQEKANIVDVNYILDLPWPIPNAKYTNRHEFSKISKNEYLLKWKQLKSTSADECFGEARFFEQDGKTLISYRNYIKPSSALAFLFKSKMKKDTLKNLKVIIKIINDWTKNKNSNYQNSMKKINLILSNKIAY